MGTIVALVFGGVFARNDDPELQESLPQIHTIGIVGAIVGVIVVVLGVLVLRRVRVAAILGMVVFAAVAAFSIYAWISGDLEGGKKGAGHVLTVAAIAGAVFQYRAWTAMR